MNVGADKSRMPSLFVSHGAPTLAIEDGPAHRFLIECGTRLTKPKSILMISAHFEARTAAVTTGQNPETLYDFGGFPKTLYQITYPAPGDPALAETVVELLGAGGLPVRRDPARGFDHGAWVPLLLMFPLADVPVVQLAMDSTRGPEYHYRLGELLRPLRDQRVLIVASGGATHNLAMFCQANRNDTAPEWVQAFGDWLAEAIENNRRDALIDYRNRAPYAARNHPTEEHYLPLLVALGATDEGEAHLRIHSSHTYGVLRMDAYAFGETDPEKWSRMDD